MMNSHFEAHYRQFERPPFAPTYSPTEDEFADPINYILKIKPEAEQYGVVKIKPPPSFRPPFAIDKEKFEFTPRIQKLNQIEGFTRSKMVFDAQLASYWHLQGNVLEIPYIDDKYLDFHALFKAVIDHGGFDEVENKKQWNEIVKILGFKSQRISKIKKIYIKWIAPFDKSVDNSVKGDESKDCNGNQSIVQIPQLHGRRRVPQPRTKSMASLRQPMKKRKKEITDPMDTVFCSVCNSGHDENKLLLCEECDRALHTYCCNPALSSVPKSDWRCQSCVMSAVKDVADSFAFQDSQTKYSLITFSEYANEFKRNYFSKNPMEVKCEDVEKEFWKKIVDVNDTVAVKYGADLLVTQVGSGFPMANYDFGGSFTDKERAYYVNHPWNLNNLPVLKDSFLSQIDTKISGMMLPWVYVGMCFSAFCWHTEDHWTYSVNYMHWGERKIWYGVSGNDGEQFDNAMKGLVPYLFKIQPDVLHHMTTAMNPKILINKGVKIYTVHQEPGDFVITFPRSYHAGYNEGLNFAEAVNFAPSDWLPKGRLCIYNYASVKRYCVFSHEELMIKIVKAAEKLSQRVREIVHSELNEIITRETRLREHVFSLGVKKKMFVEYEHIPDDFRSCAVCKTTLFISALTCEHKKLVCLEHYERICSVCTPPQLTLNYRYSLNELPLLIQLLYTEAGEFAAWRKKMQSLLNGDEEVKPTIEELRKMIDVWKIKRFPPCDLHDHALRVLKQCDQAMHNARSLMKRRIRTRNNQRVVELANISDIECLKKTVMQLPCTVPALESSINEYLNHLDDWKKRSCSLLRKNDLDDSCSCIDSLNSMIQEADDFNLNLEEIDLMEKMLNRCKWFQTAKMILASVIKKELTNGSTVDEYNDSAVSDRWTLNKLSSFINEATTLTDDSSDFQRIINQLNSAFLLGQQNEQMAQVFLNDKNNEGVGFKEAEKLWCSLRETNWMTAEYFDNFRSELVNAQYLSEKMQTIQETGNCTVKILEELVDDFSQSFLLKSSLMQKDLIKLLDVQKNFCSQIENIFVQATTFHNVVEILSSRDDLAELIEGVPTPLQPFTSHSSHDHWCQLDYFDCSEQLDAHLNALTEQQCRLMRALRQVNELRSANETCCCGVEMSDQTITCLLCHAKCHTSCVQWGEFMPQLPPGYYMCIRCLRSKRPVVEQVKAVRSEAFRSFETNLVDNLLLRSQIAGKEMLDCLSDLSDSVVTHASQEFLEIFEERMIAVLCCEVMIPDVWHSFSSAILKILPVSDSEKALCDTIKSSPISSNGFVSSLKSKTAGKRQKRKLPVNKFNAVHRKKSRNSFHNDLETCSSDVCLKPYSDHVRWIKCEAGCSRWYHYVCVGQTVGGARMISSYCCYQCANQNETQAGASRMPTSVAQPR